MRLKLCENETCRNWFIPNQDLRQKYCCSPCGKAQLKRRANRRKNGDVVEIANKKRRDLEYKKRRHNALERSRLSL